jgi:hypothetical protein
VTVDALAFNLQIREHYRDSDGRCPPISLDRDQTRHHSTLDVQ